ncbi:hypothetical protein DICPUDRAFT_153621 [Dictyostelium purpureum]|uniref:Uncharacterized protein n=1 Tax=Dictyostelium purpureum TaxID=5786 RepID=F0ZPC5_DICPU|nr:uncharacterized protein DICPUDRAFT_153621 [Dictyostelium purpureum]EGC34220.1 hypothetical protein DICPUDRAFT_153621 [Dictyostelium purpureum]|eukprot:XP_003289272.1 hypothetical protein DICPUDRAFT_153621 [Dictyostelium purpureum]
MKTKISIIGSAREPLLKKQHYSYMYDTFKKFLKDNNINSNDIILVSGGAAWSDHVAIKAFLNNLGSELIIYLPCELIKVSSLSTNSLDNDGESSNYQFKDNGNKDWDYNPGASLNYYHRIFSKEVGVNNSINEIIKAKEKGATIDTTSNGFLERNDRVSDSDIIIAFTFSKESEPKKGSGTSYTWEKSKSKFKYHFTLN